MLEKLEYSNSKLYEENSKKVLETVKNKILIYFPIIIIGLIGIIYINWDATFVKKFIYISILILSSIVGFLIEIFYQAKTNDLLPFLKEPKLTKEEIAIIEKLKLKERIQDETIYEKITRNLLNQEIRKTEEVKNYVDFLNKKEELGYKEKWFLKNYILLNFFFFLNKSKVKFIKNDIFLISFLNQ